MIALYPFDTVFAIIARVARAINNSERCGRLHNMSPIVKSNQIKSILISSSSVCSSSILYMCSYVKPYLQREGAQESLLWKWKGRLGNAGVGRSVWHIVHKEEKRSLQHHHHQSSCGRCHRLSIGHKDIEHHTFHVLFVEQRRLIDLRQIDQPSQHLKAMP